jgi:hypothetical protein
VHAQTFFRGVKFTCFCSWGHIFAKNCAKRVHMLPPWQCLFFIINTRNVMKLHVHVVQSSFVVFLWIKVIGSCKKFLKFRHFVIKPKSLAPTVAMSFDCKVTTPIIMHSGHRYKASGPLTLSFCKRTCDYQSPKWLLCPILYDSYKSKYV